MKKLDSRFLRDVQAAGWLIEAVDQGKAVAKCPRFGCGLRVNLAPGRSIPATCTPGRDLAEVAVPTFEVAKTFLRDRRNSLGLNIAEMEECIGLTKDHLAKIEPDVPTRIPNIITFLEWAQGLGYEVVLRPSGLPPKTLTTIAQTRDKSVSRISRMKTARSLQGRD